MLTEEQLYEFSSSFKEESDFQLASEYKEVMENSHFYTIMNGVNEYLDKFGSDMVVAELDFKYLYDLKESIDNALKANEYGYQDHQE